MTNLAIVAHLTVDPDKIDLVRAELEKLVPVTRAEDGCLHYDLHQDNDNPAHFMFFENWQTRDLWQAPHGGPAHQGLRRGDGRRGGGLPTL